jgi:hypothetical protein
MAGCVENGQKRHKSSSRASHGRQMQKCRWERVTLWAGGVTVVKTVRSAENRTMKAFIFFPSSHISRALCHYSTKNADMRVFTSPLFTFILTEYVPHFGSTGI